MGLADVDAVTIDGFGTLLRLRDPVASLARLLPGHAPGRIEAAFRAEAAFYRAHSHEGRDADSLTALRTRCVAVFNEALGSSLDAHAFVGALELEPVDGAFAAVEALRRRGLSLCVVANWDVSLHERLAGTGLEVVTSAEAGAPKPDAAPFRLALERLGVPPERAIHVGDEPADEQGAAAAGMRFAAAPLREAVAAWT